MFTPHTCNLIFRGVEAERSGVQGHPELLNKLKVNQRYMTPHLKKMVGKGSFNFLAFKNEN